jgi:hypothetical protein
VNANVSRRSVLKSVGAGAVALTGVVAAGPRAAAAVGSPTPQSLRNALGGKVLFPGDADYDAERATFNTIIDQHPKAIVVAPTPNDVSAAIRIGADGIGWPVAVQSTGHGICVPSDQGMLINMREMNQVYVDTSQGTARIGGGAKWSDVLAASAPAGLLPPLGSTSTVGATGYMTGGGVPVIGRAYGFAADGVRSIELVTPDGCQRHLSPTHESDLFWAVRGGEGNFGVVTSFVIDLYPAATVYGGALSFTPATAEAAYRAYVEWTRTSSDKITSVASFLRTPSTQLLNIAVVYLGSAADGAEEIAALRALNPVRDTVTEVPIAKMDSIFNVPTTPGTTVVESGLIDDLDAAGADAVYDAIGYGQTMPNGVIEVRQMGGRFAQSPGAPNAIGNRDSRFLVFMTNSAPDPSLVPSLEQAQQAALSRLGGLLTGRTVPTFLGTQDVGPQAVSTAYTDADWQRLLTLKHCYDPHNHFRLNRTIRCRRPRRPTPARPPRFPRLTRGRRAGPRAGPPWR